MPSSIDYYREGNNYRKAGDFQHAMNCYIKAIELDPNSPAVTARQMLAAQYAFYHKDYYNP